MLLCGENMFPVLSKMGLPSYFKDLIEFNSMNFYFLFFFYCRHNNPLASALTHTGTHIQYSILKTYSRTGSKQHL